MLPPRSIEANSPFRFEASERAEHEADHGQQRPVRAGRGDVELLALDVVEDPVVEVAAVAGGAEAVGGRRRDRPTGRRRRRSPRRRCRRRSGERGQPAEASAQARPRRSRAALSRCRRSFRRAGGRARGRRRSSRAVRDESDRRRRQGKQTTNAVRSTCFRSVRGTRVRTQPAFLRRSPGARHPSCQPRARAVT